MDSDEEDEQFKEAIRVSLQDTTATTVKQASAPVEVIIIDSDDDSPPAVSKQACAA